MKLTRRRFLQSALAAAALTASTFPAGAFERPPVLEQFPYGAVTLGPCRARDQFEQTMAVVLGLSEDSMLRPYRQRAGIAAPGEDLGGWYDNVIESPFQPGITDHGFAPGHCFGQWVSALARTYAINGSTAAREKMQRLIRAYVPTIKPGMYRNFRWPTYTFDKLNIMLTDAYKFADEKNALAILDRTLDTALPFFPERALDHDEMRARPHIDESYCWDESYTISENFFLAWQRGAGERYRQLGIRYLKDDTYFNPLSEGRNVLPDHHAYSYTNALSSAMQAYLSLGSEKHLRAAQNAFQMITTTQSYATGGWGPDEDFRKPGSAAMLDSLSDTHASFETPCGSYAHFKLTRYLLRVTRDPAYGDSMERVFYNTVLGALPLQDDGRTFYYSDNNFNAKKVYHAAQWPCCAGTLPQVTADYHISTYLRDAHGVFVNLYLPSSVRFTQNGVAVTLSLETRYPYDGHIRLTLDTAHNVEFALRLRIPAWAGGDVACFVNGQKLPVPPRAGTFAELARTWSAGDRVDLVLPLPTRLETLDDKSPEVVALMQGPLVLFPITEGKPAVTRAQLLAARSVREGEWQVQTAHAPLRLLPFVGINEEPYTTYVRVT